jgi:hypothetical protein
MNDGKRNVVGIKVGKFTDKHTGEVIQFGKVFTEFEDSSDKGLVGVAVEVLSCKPDIINESGINIGDVVIPLYNRYGKVTGFNFFE